MAELQRKTEGLRQRLVEFLTCPVCLDRYDQPRTLPKCKHDFCEACLRRVLSSNRGLLKCPLCRTDNTAVVPGRSVNELPRNPLLETLLVFLRGRDNLGELHRADIESLTGHLDGNGVSGQRKSENTLFDRARESSPLDYRGRANIDVTGSGHSALGQFPHPRGDAYPYVCPKCEMGFDCVLPLNVHVQKCTTTNTNFAADDLRRGNSF